MKTLFLVILSSFFSSFASAELVPSEVNTGGEVDEVLVIGEQPGPGLWKVYKDDHVLWILGTLSPLPKKLTWRSEKIEEVLVHSNELILPPRSRANLSFFKGISLVPSMIGVKKNPDSKKLQDILTAEEYSRWTLLKNKYIRQNKAVEELRPIFAAEVLYEQAIDRSGLSLEDNILTRASKLAKSNKINITRPLVVFEMDDPKDTIKKFKRSNLNDSTCLMKTVERIETDLNKMRVRANAWAVGNIDELKKIQYSDQDTICSAAFFDSAAVKESGMGEMTIRMRKAWLEAAQNALIHNQTTFAILSVSKLLADDGYLAALREKGYSIDSPQ